MENMYKKPWTDDEIALLAKNKVPHGRTESSARFKACQLGIPFRPHTQDAPEYEGVQPHAEPPRIPWTDDEIEMLRNNIVPPGRTKSSAHSVAHRHGLLFHPINSRSGRHQSSRIADNYDSVAKELRETGKIRETARKFNLSYSAVWYIAKDIGITRRKSNGR